MSELLDYVDASDNVLGQTTRAEALEQGLNRRLVHVFIFNEQGQILLQWRATHKRNPHVYDAAVGGHVDAGETYEQAAHREMMEEMGIEGELQPICKYLCEEWNEYVSLYLIKHEGPFSNWEKEAEKVEWFTVEELEHLMARLPYLFTDPVKISFEVYKKYLGEQQ